MTIQIQHRANTFTRMRFAFVTRRGGIELDVQFRRDGTPVICHDVENADNAEVMLLSELQTVLTCYPNKVFIVEIKKCRWMPEYFKEVDKILAPFKSDYLTVVSFSQSIVNFFMAHDYNVSLITGNYEMELPGGRASTCDPTAEYYIS